MAFSANFSSDIIPYLINVPISSHFFSKSTLSFLNKSPNFSATFLVSQLRHEATSKILVRSP